ncbi:NAD(P)-dependent oxidoreductase [Aquihabitans sp. McL0605]|uniref:NAD(P)-dependent oxidoreductase n=1 Tax=Aquihabitans sp. McL0605 TaxID=3415671 RepID=UPI003CF66E81
MHTEGTSERVILSTAPLRGPALAQLRELGAVIIDPWIDQRPLRLYNAEQLADRIASEGASIVICEADQCKGPVFDLPLEAIGSTRGDPTNVDLAGATAAGIPVLRAPGRNADGVAEIAVGLLLAATRGIVAADRDVREGQVYRDGSIPYQRFRGWQLAGQTVGVVGYGAVGRAAAWRFEGLGMKVISADPFAPDASHSLDDLLAEADVVSMHAAVTPETVGLIGAEQIARMKEGAVYVNTARAALHDLDALTAALQSGHLSAAALDHFEGENLSVDHPLVAMPNVVLTPHIGGASYDTESNHTALMASGLTALLAGDAPPNLANPEVLHRG